MNEIKTKKDEIIKKISVTDEYYSKELVKSSGMFLKETVYRCWIEDFVDESNGEVVSIERKEIVLNKGVVLDADTMATILFHLQAGDIESVVLSNQSRDAVENNLGNKYYWVVAEINLKKVKFLFQAFSIDNVMEIIKDYIELNFRGRYRIVSAKEFETDVIIEDDLTEVQESLNDDKYYQITVIVTYDNYENNAYAVVKTHDLDKAILLFNNYLKEKQPDEEFTTRLEEAKILQINHIIGKEFLESYKVADNGID